MGQTRRWFQVGQSVPTLVLVDIELGGVVGWLQVGIKENEYSCWTPNQDDAIYEVVATTYLNTTTFSYNPHDSEDTQNALSKAIIWVETELGPSKIYLARWKLYLLSFMFWKYKPMWENHQIAGLKLRNSQ
jgi:hypothetical protein